jgi:hypothetical protein
VASLRQRPALSPELAVAENASLPARLGGRDADPDLLAGLGLDAVAGRPARDTSLGEQQRTGPARALVLGATHDQRIIDLADDLLPLRSGRLQAYPGHRSPWPGLDRDRFSV